LFDGPDARDKIGGEGVAKIGNGQEVEVEEMGGEGGEEGGVENEERDTGGGGGEGGREGFIVVQAEVTGSKPNDGSFCLGLN